MNRFATTLFVLGAMLLVLAFESDRSPWSQWALLWLAVDFLVVALAYALRRPAMLGKRRDGTLTIFSWLFFLPFHALNLGIWNLARWTSSKPASNSVADSLSVSRRLANSEMAEQFDNILDLTAEFQEPVWARMQTGYRCLPTLDGTAPAADELVQAITALGPGRTLIHCAQGYGRTALAALVYLLAQRSVADVPAGLSKLRAARPGVALNREQLRCAEACATILASRA